MSAAARRVGRGDRYTHRARWRPAGASETRRRTSSTTTSTTQIRSEWERTRVRLRLRSNRTQRSRTSPENCRWRRARRTRFSVPGSRRGPFPFNALLLKLGPLLLDGRWRQRQEDAFLHHGFLTLLAEHVAEELSR